MVRVGSGVARSASKKPTKRDSLVSRPRRTAAPLPGRAHPITDTGTRAAGSASARATRAVSSELPLSTTTMLEVHGRPDR